VLQRVKTVERETGDIFTGAVYPENATGFAWIVAVMEH